MTFQSSWHKKRRTLIAWAILAIWVGFIYATLNTVPIWREALQKKYGESVFATITYIAAGILFGSILAIMIFKNREKKLLPYIGLVGVLLFLRYVLRHWITIPVEQIHFIEYGLVGYLSFNALSRHLKGWGLITAALVLTYLFGMFDECIQGNLASRVGEQRDMYWNGLAGLMSLTLITLSLRPKAIYAPSGKSELRTHLLIISLCLLTQGYFNIAIAQFGVLIEDVETGTTFRSRLQPQDLSAYNHELNYFKTEIAPQVGRTRMIELLTQVPDRIHEEVLVHAFRRGVYLWKGDYFVAAKEDGIIKKYFYHFVEGTALDWSADKSAIISQQAGDSLQSPYESPVAAHLITLFTKTQMWIVIILLEIGIISWLYLLSRSNIRITRVNAKNST